MQVVAKIRFIIVTLKVYPKWCNVYMLKKKHSISQTCFCTISFRDTTQQTDHHMRAHYAEMNAVV